MSRSGRDDFIGKTPHLTEYILKVTAPAIGFRPVNESSGRPLSLHRMFYAVVISLGLRVSIGVAIANEKCRCRLRDNGSINRVIAHPHPRAPALSHPRRPPE
ncbi:hypothetical protein EVAR_38265_1 [Eumeta japonica]|uniref:Uncharacterized protein n=1 Tax=Eumeta variegata TaxID=151549 RepID=A0A4C1W709_EUMVA|nr:hypothetical protein EVAR_38265_1 [Eumeta japonica]